MARLQREAEARVKAHAVRPAPVAGLTRAIQNWLLSFQPPPGRKERLRQVSAGRFSMMLRSACHRNCHMHPLGTFRKNVKNQRGRTHYGRLTFSLPHAGIEINHETDP